MFKKKYILHTVFVLILIFTSVSAVYSEQRLYWDFPEPLRSADAGRFPQIVSTGDSLAVIWQSFHGKPESLDAYISIHAVFSQDGKNWSTPVTVADNISYLWFNKVPLFSAAAGKDGRLAVAVAETNNGVSVFVQKNKSSGSEFIRAAQIKPGPDAADSAIAPKLVFTPHNKFMLFLTRRIKISGGLRPTTQTIFYLESDDAEKWSSPELFVDPQKDPGYGDNAVLEHNFLPSYVSDGENEYVAFQTLRQGPGGQVFQIYIKVRKNGGKWEKAVTVTEKLVPESNPQDPLMWDNQRPFLGITHDNKVLLTWERNIVLGRPDIAAVEIDKNGNPVTSKPETVVRDRYVSVFPRIFTSKNTTWFMWFDTTGIRLASRSKAFSYNRLAVTLDRNTPGADRGSVLNPYPVIFKGNPYFVWQDRAGGLARVIILRPDLNVDIPSVKYANFRSGYPGNKKTLIVDWNAPVDSSGILSYSWKWSRNSQDVPSRAEEDQIYTEKRSVFTIPEPENSEGMWYFSLIARDEAGNWSKPLRLTYIFDITPPPPPIIKSPPTDPYGYLTSNTFEITWMDAEKESAYYYTWRMDYLGADPGEINPDKYKSINPFAGGSGTQSKEKKALWKNLDNGIWAFSVAAVDMAGNTGLPNTEIFLTKHYIPVTFITNVTAGKDASELLKLRITGRGFSVGGEITSVVIDRDGKAPWDYEYLNKEGYIKFIAYDRIIEVSGIDNVEQGTYYIGVVHPVRGSALWDQRMKIDSVGNIKFGTFGIYKYEPLWKPAAGFLHLTGNAFILLIAVLVVLSAFVISVIRLISISREIKVLANDARAVLSGTFLFSGAEKEIAGLVRRKGMGLRRKFMFTLTFLVLITIIIVAFILGFIWIKMERNTQALNLENKSRLLIETLASSAVNSIPSAKRGELMLLPEKINAFEDAEWTTVTGPKSQVVNGVLKATTEGYNYVWASNDPDILDKLLLPPSIGAGEVAAVMEAASDEQKEIFGRFYKKQSDGSYKLEKDSVNLSLNNRKAVSSLFRSVNIMPSELDFGRYALKDGISKDIEKMKEEVELAVEEAGVPEKINNLRKLDEEYKKAAQKAALTLDFNNPEFLEINAARAAQSKEIETILLEISNRYFKSYPEFSAESLKNENNEVFIFYKPVLYRSGYQNFNYYKGTVRLAVSVKNIRTAIYDIQKRIIIMTVFAAVIALLLGIMAAMFISSLMLKPINLLVNNVSKIRDEPDMKKHKDFQVLLDTKDELSQLAETITDMVQSLVQAAFDQQELIAGQEIQKQFLTNLEVKDGRKLSTGRKEDTFFKLFGYYEGTDAVSGDYFDFRSLDKDHYVMIKMDISGHGVTASMIMVQVAALYVDYFRKVRDRAKKTGILRYNLKEFLFDINDILNEIGFQGRFAAINISVINVRTAEYEMAHAGDNIVHIYDNAKGKMKVIKLPVAPAAGQVSSDLVEMNPENYKPVKGRLNRGDIMFMFTDGIEESRHVLRDENFNEIPFSQMPEEIKEKYKSFIEDNLDTSRPPEIVEQDREKLMAQAFEEFSIKRMYDIVEAVKNKSSYILERCCDITIGKPLHFDFSGLSGSVEDVVLALISVEKVFRLVPNTAVGIRSRVKVDRKINEFLKNHFKEYKEFYNHPVDDEPDSPYIYFTHMEEDKQEDDLTLWTYQRL